MTIPTASLHLLDTLASRIGRPHVLIDPADMAGYLVEERGLYRGTALAVARPRDTAEVAFVMKECAAADVPVVAQSGNTGLTGGGVPYGGVVLSLARLDRIREVDAVNAAITVEAGCILKRVQEAASAAGCLFPLSLASEGSCRIGGNLSTNAGGTGVLRYGNARDLVLGLEVVLPDGRVWEGLRGLRKDNTGYDLKHLFIGAEGTLGIITAAVVKLFPKPRSQATAFVAVEGPAAAVKLLSLLRERVGERITGFELIQRICLDLVLKHIPAQRDPLNERHPWYVLVELSDSTEGGALGGLLEEALGAAIEAGLVQDAAMASSKAQQGEFWKLRENISEAQK